MAVAVAAGGSAVVWSAHSAKDLPSLAALRAAPPASIGLLSWAPRGRLAGDEGFVRQALRTLRSSSPVGKPRSHLHLLYAGDQGVLLEGRDRNTRPALALVADGHVLVNPLSPPAPVALTLPVGAGLRFLVQPARNGVPRPAVVWGQDASLGPTGEFRRLPADATGLTEEFQPASGDARFVVLEPEATGAGDHLQGDGVVVTGSLTPAVPAIRLTRSPWPTQGDQAPFRQWLADAELLGAKLAAAGPVRVASLTGGGGFTPGPPRPDGRTYSGGLYAVTDGPGRDYVGYVLRFGDEPLCHRLTPVRGRFADLLVVGDRCELPGESKEAIQVITRADARRAAVELSGRPGSPPRRLPYTGGELIDLEEPGYSNVTLTAATDRSAATYVVPPP